MRFSTLLLMVFTLVTSCNPKPLNQLIVGSWEIDNFKISDPAIQNEVKEHAARLAESVQYIFMEDGSYTIKSSSLPEGKRGIWAYRPSTDDLVLEMQREAPSIIKVVKTKQNKLLCESPTSPLGKVSFELTRITE